MKRSGSGRSVDSGGDSEDTEEDSDDSEGSEEVVEVDPEDSIPKKLLDINFEISRVVLILNDTNIVQGDIQTLPLIVVRSIKTTAESSQLILRLLLFASVDRLM